MKIEKKYAEEVAKIGDVLEIESDVNEVSYYVYTQDVDDCDYLYLVNLQSGMLSELDVYSNEEIKKGMHLDGFGFVRDIIPNQKITLTFSK